MSSRTVWEPNDLVPPRSEMIGSPGAIQGCPGSWGAVFISGEPIPAPRLARRLRWAELLPPAEQPAEATRGRRRRGGFRGPRRPGKHAAESERVGEAVHRPRHTAQRGVQSSDGAPCAAAHATDRLIDPAGHSTDGLIDPAGRPVHGLSDPAGRLVDPGREAPAD